MSEERSPFPTPMSGNRGTERSPFPGAGVGNTGTPTYLDVAALLDGGLPERPEPVLLRRTDGHAIFYAGQVNTLFGDPESGKTLVAQAAVAEGLINGRRAAFVDIDHNGPQAIICRFLDMDVPRKCCATPAGSATSSPRTRRI
jgi:hypothetical protein